MTHTSEGINTGEISNNDLFARKISGRIDLDLVYLAISVNLSHSVKDITPEVA